MCCMCSFIYSSAQSCSFCTLMCFKTYSNYHLAGASDEEQSRMGKLGDETKKEKQQVADAMKPKVGSDAQTEPITVLLRQVEQLMQVMNSHV